MSDPERKPSWPYRLQLVLRRHDQVGAAVLWLVLAGGLIFFFVARNYNQRGLIEIDRAEQRQVTYLVDINTAEWPEFANLPGIGEHLAKSIVQHRSLHGPFVSHEQLTDVNGIGEGKLKNLRDYLVPLKAARE